MQVSAYLNYPGTCEEAFKFYEKALGGTLESTFTFGDTPAAGSVPPDWKNKIMHARLTFGDSEIMGSDAPPDRYSPAGGFSMSVQATSPEEAERFFSALSSGGRVTMPIQQTFWAARFGMLVDRFGIPWMVNCDPPAGQ